MTALGETSLPFRTLLHWMRERENIRIRKEDLGRDKPWSDDPIFQSTRFCNVRREDDRVTRWIKENWRDPYQDHPHLAFAMCLARVVNLPPTLAELGFPEEWDANRFILRMDELSAGGRKLWTGAYMVTGGYSKGGETKQQIMARVLDAVYPLAGQITTEHSLADAAELIQRAPGFGTFLAAQVIADLKYTPLLKKTKDWESWCAPGPGSTMGLNILYGRDPKASVSQVQFLREVNDLRETLKEYDWFITSHDVQNCLCEFSKYWRIKYLAGRAKNGYPGA
jgi:hypothetical protein